MIISCYMSPFVGGRTRLNLLTPGWTKLLTIHVMKQQVLSLFFLNAKALPVFFESLVKYIQIRRIPNGSFTLSPWDMPWSLPGPRHSTGIPNGKFKITFMLGPCEDDVSVVTRHLMFATKHVWNSLSLLKTHLNLTGYVLVDFAHWHLLATSPLVASSTRHVLSLKSP